MLGADPRRRATARPRRRRRAAARQPDIDCFQSQFIFKNPGVIGQPWHQDSYYFRFDRQPQVGVWLALSEATLENGCLWVVPGSHAKREIFEHIPDRRPAANRGYQEIVNQDVARQVPALMQPGDVLFFDSYLMHHVDRQRRERAARSDGLSLRRRRHEGCDARGRSDPAQRQSLGARTAHRKSGHLDNHEAEMQEQTRNESSTTPQRADAPPAECRFHVGARAGREAAGG